MAFVAASSRALPAVCARVMPAIGVTTPDPDVLAVDAHEKLDTVRAGRAPFVRSPRPVSASPALSGFVPTALLLLVALPLVGASASCSVKTTLTTRRHAELMVFLN
ncbi:MAG TPA: hypothetical protein VM580_03495 [Labilithrix sp.]|nr:hypothetical protein [Labilithrix sp.]